jgi:signal transduction histidine kinase
MSTLSIREADEELDGRRTPQYENDREREFYRYYRPLRELGQHDPHFCDMKTDVSIAQHLTSPSPDPALTAFCQLGALRLNVRRALMFFFDSKHSYVLAEATKTTNIRTGTCEDPADALCLGHTVMPRGVSVCEYTVLLPPTLPQNFDVRRIDSNVAYVVNDLAKDPEFRESAFVTGGPRARFYAGVPITTPNGINIGAYCILDDKPRHGLTAPETTFLAEMSSTVSIHLEMLRAAAEHQLGTKMIAGLGAFIDGDSDLRDYVEQERSQGPSNSFATLMATSKSTESFLRTEDQPGKIVEMSPSPSSSSRVPLNKRVHKDSITDVQSDRRPASSRSSSKNKSIEDSASADIEATFLRAAKLVREALSVDGVQFLDARFGTPGTSPTSATSSEHSGPGTPESEAGASRQLNTNSIIEESPVEMCNIFASSSQSGPVQVPQKLLRRLLQRYRNGKIWFFDKYERWESPSPTGSDREGSSSETGELDPAVPVGGNTMQSSQFKRASRKDDRREMLRLFPNARSVCFVGMWDHTSQRWSAASFSWTSSPFRHFSEEFDLKYVTAFCDVILAELQRLEATRSDRAKSDFISTISHELRSPLHGILGSVELLNAAPNDPLLSSSDLISQVEVCSRTLLDVIDHLLDYSGINQRSKSGTSSVTKASSRMAMSMASKGSLETAEADAVRDTDVNLDRITEEVVEAALYSFCFGRARDVILERKVAVILDIDSNFDWRCTVNLGAWKRVCINLVSNALKYTNSGHVRVTLRAERNGDGSFIATLEVSDTGCGMSRDFLDNHLFTAFTQENSFVEGTGLGLNLVSKIVREWGGNIDVRSEKGQGSTFTLKIPLDSCRKNSTDSSSADSSATPESSEQEFAEDLVVGIVGAEIDASNPSTDDQKTGREILAQQLLNTSIDDMLTRLGISHSPCSRVSHGDFGVNIITETRLRDELVHLEALPDSAQNEPPSLSKTPLVIICNSVISARTLTKAELLRITSGHVELILQPVGPCRLKRAVTACVQSLTKSDTPAVSLRADNATLRSASRAREADLSDGSRPGSSSSNKAFRRPFYRVKASGRNPSNSPRPSYEARSFRLPHHRGPSGEHDALKMEKNGKTGASTGSSGGHDEGGLSLLLVDDNVSFLETDLYMDLPTSHGIHANHHQAVNMKILSTFAERSGYRKLVATDGQQAVDLYTSTCPPPQRSTSTSSTSPDRSSSVSPHTVPDGPSSPSSTSSSSQPTENPRPRVILMDINMPQMDGYEATRRIRALEKRHRVQPPATIIGLSGLGSEKARQDAFKAGMSMFLTKPVRLQELKRILGEIGG